MYSVKLAVKERNAAGGFKGRQIQLIALDDQGKQSEAVTAVTKLTAEDHAVAVIGEVASSLSLAGGKVAQRAGIREGQVSALEHTAAAYRSAKDYEKATQYYQQALKAAKEAKQ